MWETDEVESMRKWKGNIEGVMGVMEKVRDKPALRPEGVERVEELIAVMKEVLEEMHQVPTLAGLAVGRVVEEGLEVGELPTTLRRQVEEWTTERQKEARHMLDKIRHTLTAFFAFVVDERERNH